MNIQHRIKSLVASALCAFSSTTFTPILFVLVLLLSACDPNDDGGVIGTGIMDGGIIGTGIVVRGTASENRQFARAEVDARPPSLIRSTGLIAADGQFTIDTALTDSTWLLRTDLGNNQYRFGIAFNESNAHVHSYTDAALRNWFLREHSVQDLNVFFEGDTNLRYPTEQEYKANALQLLAYVRPALNAYGLEPNDVLDNTFRTDNAGIDQYLDDNPLVLSNDSITILLTEPDIKFQSTNRSGLSLSQQFDPADFVAPSVPEGLQALGSDVDEIILIWEPAADNTAVVEYQVYRDGAPLGRTAFPVYIDQGVQAGGAHQYEITAFDLEGNESAPSIAAVGMPLLGVPAEIMRPAAPSNLTENLATPSRVELSWSQNPVAGVVAFNVYRGDDGATPTLLVKVAGDELTDATVTGDTNYTYEVRAVGPTGVESDASASITVLTTGIVIVTPINNSGVPALFWKVGWFSFNEWRDG